MLFLYQLGNKSKPLYFGSHKKENKVVVHKPFHYKTILTFDIYTKLFLHTLTGCDTTSLTDGVGKAIRNNIWKLLSNKHLQEAALNKLHEEV